MSKRKRPVRKQRQAPATATRQEQEDALVTVLHGELMGKLRQAITESMGGHLMYTLHWINGADVKHYRRTMDFPSADFDTVVDWLEMNLRTERQTLRNDAGTRRDQHNHGSPD